MKRTRSHDDPKCLEVPLEGDLDVFGIGPIWERLAPLAQGSHAAICLDLAGVGDLDLSGIQALLLLDRAVRSRGGVLTLRNLRTEWQTRFNQLGLEQLSSLGEKEAS